MKTREISPKKKTGGKKVGKKASFAQLPANIKGKVCIMHNSCSKIACTENPNISCHVMYS